MNAILDIDINVGEIITFGKYDWRVLAKEDDKALIITKNIIAQKPYNEEWVITTWENCSLRFWLNTRFLNEFNEAEQSRIVVEEQLKTDNLWYSTKDKVFLLSLEEADEYFGDSGDYLNKRRKKFEEGAFIEDENGYCFSNSFDAKRIAAYRDSAEWWWLRSTGKDGSDAALVDGDGYVYVFGTFVNTSGGVRPALWLRCG